MWIIILIEEYMKLFITILSIRIDKDCFLVCGYTLQGLNQPDIIHDYNQPFTTGKIILMNYGINLVLIIELMS